MTAFVDHQCQLASTVVSFVSNNLFIFTVFSFLISSFLLVFFMILFNNNSNCCEGIASNTNDLGRGVGCSIGSSSSTEKELSRWIGVVECCMASFG